MYWYFRVRQKHPENCQRILISLLVSVMGKVIKFFFLYLSLYYRNKKIAEDVTSLSQEKEITQNAFHDPLSCYFFSSSGFEAE